MRKVADFNTYNILSEFCGNDIAIKFYEECYRVYRKNWDKCLDIMTENFK